MYTSSRIASLLRHTPFFLRNGYSIYSLAISYKESRTNKQKSTSEQVLVGVENHEMPRNR